MPDVSILSESDLRDLLSLDRDIVCCIEDAFKALATKPVIMPPVLHLEIAEANGEIDVKTAYVPGLDSLAIKMSPGFFDNPKIGLPSLNGLMVVFSAKTGLVEAILLDNGYLTELRTAAAGGVAADWLARKDARTAGIVGAGVQARLQLKALSLVRPLESALVWARDGGNAEACAQEMTEALGIPISACNDIAALCAQSDVVITTTPSNKPLIDADHLRPGLTFIAMGSDAAYKNEIAAEALAAADVYVCDRLSQVRLLGELHHAIEAGKVDAHAAFPELGEIIAGSKAGRENDRQCVLCDLTGTGVQDTAIATLAVARARGAGAGTVFQS
ncbi:cyclodeaminase [Pelagibius sp. CAU 1746]|uniref:cyclodeaminase n=1 Tax=Pelagibius sp. CAU 1746 TaxID=3140370 RepID=UPI00325BD0BA